MPVNLSQTHRLSCSLIVPLYFLPFHYLTLNHAFYHCTDAFEVRRQETTAESAEGLNGSASGGATASEGHCEGHLVSQSDAPGQVKRAGGNVSGKKTKAIMRPTKDSAEQETTDVCSSMAAWYCVSPFCIDTKYLNPNTTSAP